ncbi:hypothetical protein VP01_3881g1 [Puccinia sorghi]|uniref:Uncharacterized protein n=1 Tax=Puccinia sorghi TaxID=27349 RepID=A0A0L6UUT3_9BASI|nr:hypothetical protein VP01_3881g1 [Puccinia sorghi]
MISSETDNLNFFHQDSARFTVQQGALSLGFWVPLLKRFVLWKLTKLSFTQANIFLEGWACNPKKLQLNFGGCNRCVWCTSPPPETKSETEEIMQPLSPFRSATKIKILGWTCWKPTPNYHHNRPHRKKCSPTTPKKTQNSLLHKKWPPETNYSNGKWKPLKNEKKWKKMRKKNWCCGAHGHFGKVSGFQKYIKNVDHEYGKQLVKYSVMKAIQKSGCPPPPDGKFEDLEEMIEVTLQKKLAQLPAVDMEKVPGSFCFYSNHSPKMIQPSFDAQSLCILHIHCSHCSKKITYANSCSLDGSLAGACWISTAGNNGYAICIRRSGMYKYNIFKCDWYDLLIYFSLFFYFFTIFFLYFFSILNWGGSADQNQRKHNPCNNPKFTHFLGSPFSCVVYFPKKKGFWKFSVSIARPLFIL